MVPFGFAVLEMEPRVSGVLQPCSAPSYTPVRGWCFGMNSTTQLEVRVVLLVQVGTGEGRVCASVCCLAPV